MNVKASLSIIGLGLALAAALAGCGRTAAASGGLPLPKNFQAVSAYAPSGQAVTLNAAVTPLFFAGPGDAKAVQQIEHRMHRLKYAKPVVIVATGETGTTPKSAWAAVGKAWGSSAASTEPVALQAGVPDLLVTMTPTFVWMTGSTVHQQPGVPSEALLQKLLAPPTPITPPRAKPGSPASTTSHRHS